MASGRASIKMELCGVMLHSSIIVFITIIPYTHYVFNQHYKFENASNERVPLEFRRCNVDALFVLHC